MKSGPGWGRFFYDVKLKFLQSCQAFFQSFDFALGIILLGFLISQINQKAIKKEEDSKSLVKDLPHDKPVIICGVLPNGCEKYYAFGF
ncbi:hypothetical protein [Croceimicrobium hydrocarbonivorans]|uniref:Uncharacterized protein n=1 Tax=Croceimicrobium hydrocarbonivorans TaxID=2761580 RepID=A0A7H0VD19_9FLAO|nr:hypothetical protein [Croceimicrobium hydrocarbonivorans]QNR23617.1 hypothetical protein H4K34_14715 [Croceimicrobium hydrocarbonivorans]